MARRRSPPATKASGARRPRGPRPDADVELVKMAVLSKRSGVPTPTIKHYIREGLLPGPHVRTSRNMAYYDARGVDRIRAIKTLQAERFLPLRVILEMLEPAPSARLKKDARADRRALTTLAPAVTPGPDVTRRRRSDVVQMSPITRRELAELEREGVLEAKGKGDLAGYGGRDLEIVELLIEIRRLGYGHVFPISIGRAYVDAVRRLLETEIEQFRRHALHAELPGSLPEAARHAVEFGERLIIALRAKMLPALLARLD